MTEMISFWLRPTDAWNHFLILRVPSEKGSEIKKEEMTRWAVAAGGRALLATYFWSCSVYETPQTILVSRINLLALMSTFPSDSVEERRRVPEVSNCSSKVHTSVFVTCSQVKSLLDLPANAALPPPAGEGLDSICCFPCFLLEFRPQVSLFFLWERRPAVSHCSAAQIKVAARTKKGRVSWKLRLNEDVGWRSRSCWLSMCIRFSSRLVFEALTCGQCHCVWIEPNCSSCKTRFNKSWWGNISWSLRRDSRCRLLFWCIMIQRNRKKRVLQIQESEIQNVQQKLPKTDLSKVKLFQTKDWMSRIWTEGRRIMRTFREKLWFMLM